MMRLTSFTIDPGARWDVTVQEAAFPADWIGPLERAWYARPNVGKGWSLPTRRLTELLMGLDPAIIHAGQRRDRGQRGDGSLFVWGLPGADTEIVAAAIASWAITEVAGLDDCTDWWNLCQPGDLHFRDTPVNLLEYGTWPNGTADPAAAMFGLLPTFLAQEVAAARMPLLGRTRDWILGPPQANGRRAAVLWPPVELEDEKSGGGLATAKVTFHTETVPTHPVPVVHADLSLSRFPRRPVTYVPSRGDKPPAVSIWLHAPAGFLREAEPHTLLSGAAWKPWGRGRRWQWKPGLATVLSRLTHLPFPDPEAVLADPATAAGNARLRAYVLYSEGSKSLGKDVEDTDELEALEEAERTGKARSFLHCANTGFVPADHLENHAQVAALLARHGIRPQEEQAAQDRQGHRRVRPRETSGQQYTIELWTQSELTREAVLAALQHHHKLTPQADAEHPDIINFTGDLTLRILLRDVGTLAAGITREEDDSRPDRVLLQERAAEIARTLGNSTEPRAAVFELEGADYFSRARKIDPKPALKKGFIQTNRRLQCLRPGKLFVPPAEPPDETKKKKKREPYPGTKFTKGTIYRASAAINDALRQLGRLGIYDTPESLPDLEQIGIWMHESGNTRIPIVLRLTSDGAATAYLASGKGNATVPVPYSELAKALADGKGRIPGGRDQKERISRFLGSALGVGDAGARDTHDRVVLVRSASFRRRGWDWLQDMHIQPNLLAMPGDTFDDDSKKPRLLTPEECPGLRIVRVREDEVGRGFKVDEPKVPGRISGLFPFIGRVYYSINPRSDQMQTPLGATKLDPDILKNFTRQASSPLPLEIFPAFLQPGDKAEDYAELASSLRRMYLHTEQATKYPAALHLCELADEYI